MICRFVIDRIYIIDLRIGMVLIKALVVFFECVFYDFCVFCELFIRTICLEGDRGIKAYIGKGNTLGAAFGSGLNKTDNGDHN
jgi:hypothetical protein